MACKVEYSEENNYLIRTFHGSICSSEILSTWIETIEKKLRSNKFIGVINDFSDAELKMEPKDLDQLMSLFKENNKIFRNLKLAAITTSPENVVFPILAQSKSPFNIKAFSTLEGAKAWMRGS